MGASNTTVNSETYAATITYYDGSGGMDVSGSSDIFSGLSGTGTIGLGDGRTYTLHAYDPNNAATFTGDITKQGGGSANAYVIKTGTGAQELTGQLKLEGSTAGLKIYDGNLTLAGSADNKIIEYVTTIGGGTPVLELNNTSSGTGQLVQIGLANTWSADYNGSVYLNGSDGDARTKIKISKSRDDAGFEASKDYNRTQIFSGVVSSTGTNALVKDGAGQLELSGDNTFTGGVKLRTEPLLLGTPMH